MFLLLYYLYATVARKWSYLHYRQSSTSLSVSALVRAKVDPGTLDIKQEYILDDIPVTKFYIILI